MSDLFNYRNANLIGSVIEGYEYNFSKEEVDVTSSIFYIIDKTELLVEGNTIKTEVYVVVLIDPAYTTYTSIDSSNLILTSITYVTTDSIVEIKEFPKTTPLVSMENGLMGANIKGYEYNPSKQESDVTLVTCKIVDKIKILISDVLTDVYVCVLYSGTTGSNKLYVPFTSVTEVVSFGIIDYGRPSVLRYTGMNFKQDATATTILFLDITTGNILREEAINSIQAINTPPSTDIVIQRTGGEEIITRALELSVTQINGVVAGATIAAGVIALNTLFVNASAGGEVNTASNVGTGVGVFKQKVGVDLEFKTLAASTGISIVGGTNEISVFTISPVFSETQMDFVQDATATTILFKDSTTGNILRAEPINAIQAVANGTDIRIQRTGGEEIFVDALDITTTYIDGVLVTAVLATAVNELNSLYALTTGAIGKLPTITSGDILLTFGNPINYIVTGDNIASVDYDLTGLPAATLTTPLYNQFNLIGGTLLPVGSYTFTVHCFNYWGQTSKVINISVSSSYSNTYSYEGNTMSYFTKNAVGSENDTPFYRATGATGPAWTLFSWIKRNSSSAAWSVVFHFGDYGSAAGGTNAGTVYMLCRTYGGNLQFWFVYGDWSGNYVRSGLVATYAPVNVWFSYQIVYDGTTTNNSLATNPFSFYVNGVAISPTWAYGGTGYAGSIEYMPLLTYPSKSLFKLGRGNAYSTEVYAPNMFFDELALWQSDQSANASAFYNVGTPIDLASYNPYQYYRFGDGTPTDISTFPTMNNRGSIGVSGDLEMFNGTVGLYVSDVP